MFSKNILLKHKAVYIAKNDDDKFSIEISIKSNHALEPFVLRTLEEDIKRIQTPNQYKIEVKDK